MREGRPAEGQALKTIKQQQQQNSSSSISNSNSNNSNNNKNNNNNSSRVSTCMMSRSRKFGLDPLGLWLELVAAGTDRQMLQ